MPQETIAVTRKAEKPYIHAEYETRRKILRFLLRTIGFTVLVKVDRVEGMEHFPPSGPGIVMINHIAFVDSIIVLHLMPRNLVPMAKIEVYNYPVVGIFPRIWGVIPVHREEMDRAAIRRATEVLRAGEMILIAPEGTRHNALEDAREGIAYIAARTGAPVIPVAIDGTIGFPTTPLSRRWKGPGARVRIGRPFRYHPDIKRPDRTQLRLMTDEAMYVLAGMLPENRRGVYSDLSKATETTFEYL